MTSTLISETDITKTHVRRIYENSTQILKSFKLPNRPKNVTSLSLEFSNLMAHWHLQHQRINNVMPDALWTSPENGTITIYFITTNGGTGTKRYRAVFILNRCAHQNGTTSKDFTTATCNNKALVVGDCASTTSRSRTNSDGNFAISSSSKGKRGKVGEQQRRCLCNIPSDVTDCNESNRKRLKRQSRGKDGSHER